MPDGAMGPRVGVMSVCKLHDERQPASSPEASHRVGTNKSTMTFRVYRRTGIALPPHLGAGTAEITLAFPDTEVLHPQQIFTFLPVCHSGLPFAVNAQFELVSSRQQVHEDSLLNQWLRDEIAPTLIAALDACEPLKERLGDLLTAAKVTSPFWKPVIVDIIGRIRSTACLRTESGRFVLPEQAIRRSVDAAADLVSNDALQRACGLEFVDASMSEMAERLGCRGFAIKDMGRLINHADEPHADGHHTSDVDADAQSLSLDRLALNLAEPVSLTSSDTQQWLQRLYRYLNIVLEPSDIESVLWTLRIFPTIVESGKETMASLSEGRIFASLDDDWLFLRGNAVRVLNEGTLTKDTEGFLTAVGILPATRKEVLHTIVTAHSQGKFADGDAFQGHAMEGLAYQQAHEHGINAIWAGLTFIKDNMHTCIAAGETSMEELANTLVIPSAVGVVVSARECGVSTILGCDCPLCSDAVLADVRVGRWPMATMAATTVALTPSQRMVTGPSTMHPGGKLDWEAFFLSIGAGLHSTVCETSQSHASTGRGLQCLSEVEACPICLESLPLSGRSAVLDGCGHRFCPECIMDWLVSSASASGAACPLCRKQTATSAVLDVQPDPFFVNLSMAVSHTIEYLSQHPTSNRSKLLRTALEAMAKDDITCKLIACTEVPTSLGDSSLSSCFVAGDDSPQAMNCLLPQIMLAPRCSPTVAASVAELFSKFGSSETTTIPGVLNSIKVMKQGVMDGGQQPAGGSAVIVAAFASAITLLDRLLASACGTSGYQTMVAAVVEAFADTPLIFVGVLPQRAQGGRGTRSQAFKKSSEIVWRGNTKVLDQIGKVAVSGLYGAALKAFFGLLGLSALDAAGCWDGLRMLADHRGSVVEIATEIYQELEHFHGTPDFGLASFHEAHVLVYDRRTNMRRVVACAGAPILLNDDPYAYDVFADTHHVWLDTSTLDQCPRLFAFLISPASGRRSGLKCLSECVTNRGSIVVSEPLAHEREWTLWCRQFINKTFTTYGQAPSAQVRKLSTTLTVLRAEKISVSMTLLVPGRPDSIEAEKTYPLVTDQSSGRVIVSRQSTENVDWVCRHVGAELGTMLYELWEVCDQRTLEWTAYAHLMAQCGRRPRALKDLEPIVHDTARIESMGYGGGGRGLAGHQIRRGRPRVQFPASLPPPLDLDRLPSSPATGGSGGRPAPSSTKNSAQTSTEPKTKAAITAASIADTPEHVSADLLRQQVASLQAQLAEQARMLQTSQQTITALEARQEVGETAEQLRATIVRDSETIRRLADQVERLSQQPEPEETCPVWASPCRDGATCAHRGDATHSMAFWHPPR